MRWNILGALWTNSLETVSLLPYWMLPQHWDWRSGAVTSRTARSPAAFSRIWRGVLQSMSRMPAGFVRSQTNIWKDDTQIAVGWHVIFLFCLLNGYVCIHGNSKCLFDTLGNYYRGISEFLYLYILVGALSNKNNVNFTEFPFIPETLHGSINLLFSTKIKWKYKRQVRSNLT